MGLSTRLKRCLQSFSTEATWCIAYHRTRTAATAGHYALIVGDPVANTAGDYILLQITSTKYSGRTDYTILDSDPEFAQTGLSHASTFRCHKVFVLASSRVQRRIGSVGPMTMAEIEKRLRIALSLS